VALCHENFGGDGGKGELMTGTSQKGKESGLVAPELWWRAFIQKKASGPRARTAPYKAIFGEEAGTAKRDHHGTGQRGGNPCPRAYALTEDSRR